MKLIRDTLRPDLIEGLQFTPGVQYANLSGLRRLIWLYFWVLILEGALRKWFLPQFSDPLLLARDPIMILIYLQASRLRLLPRGPWMQYLAMMMAASVLLTMAQFALQMAPPLVLAYGLRCDFLHLPLIFILPQVMTTEDIRKLGRWFLLLSVPMAILMLDQFRSGPDAWINRGAGIGGRQIESALGKIRPAGSFSFISGPVLFFSIVVAYIGFGLAGRTVYPRWLLICSSASTVIALVVSGSRNAVLSSGIVALTVLISYALARKAAVAITRLILVGLVVAYVLGDVEELSEGTAVLRSRFMTGSGQKVNVEELQGRFVDSLVGPFRDISDVPLMGYGLGVGTNVGAKLIKGEMGFLLSEGEWGRILLEMGPFIGIGFILFRLALMIWLGRQSYRCARQGHILPLAFFAASATNILNGQWGQATTLGFACLGGGLALAAIKNIDREAMVLAQTQDDGFGSLPMNRKWRRRAPGFHS